jgi:hypothetical protein
VKAGAVEGEGAAAATAAPPPDPHVPRLTPEDRRRIVALWALWSAGILVLAAAAMALPTSISSPWTAATNAPPLARWDSVWYHDIAVRGYRYDPASPENNIGFYPLYPLAVRLLSSALHAPLFTTGVALSLICLLAALLFLGDLFAAGGGREAVPWAVAALLLFPTSFFLAAFYSESLFLATTAGAFWCARSRRWIGAGLLGAAAALTRFNGFLILLPIAWFLAQDLRGKWRSFRMRHAAAVALPAAGAAAFPLYLWWRWGDPLLYVRSKDVGWHKAATPIWEVVRRVAREGWFRLQDPNAGGKLDWLSGVVSTLLFVGLTVWLFRRRHVAGGLYCAATLLLLVHSGNLDGMPRFVLALFPCFFPLGQLLRREPVLAFAYAFFGVGTGMVLLHRFVHWIIIA